MMRQRITLILAAVTIGVIAIWAGAPAGTVLLLDLILACPLMMLVMMRGMGSAQHQDRPRTAHHHTDGRR